MTEYVYSFTYCGINCEDQGLIFIPDAKSRGDFLADYTVADESVTGRDGKYWYNTAYKERTFSLDCMYEDQTRGQIERIYRWVHKDTHGELIFSDRPWCKYIVRPSKTPTQEKYQGVEHYGGDMVFSGKMTLTFTAYEPFALVDMSKFNELDEESKAHAMDQVGQVADEDMPEIWKPTLGWDDTTTQDAKQRDKSPNLDMETESKYTSGIFPIYNPGTEKTNHVKIRIAGYSPNGVTIYNYTTGDVCRLVSLPQLDGELNDQDGLLIDSYAGVVQRVRDGSYAFSYHNFGYITLANCGFYRRDIPITTTANSNIINSTDGSDIFLKDFDVNKYIHIGDKWYKIIYIRNSTSAIVNETIQTGGSYSATLAQMNEIEIVGDALTKITKFEMEYSPLVR